MNDPDIANFEQKLHSIALDFRRKQVVEMKMLEPPAVSHVTSGNRKLTASQLSKLENLKFSISELISICTDAFKEYRKTDQLAKIAHDQLYLKEKYRTFVSQAIESLEEGDEYWLIISEQPWEFQDPKIASIVIKASLRGVLINYLFPDTGSSSESNLYIKELCFNNRASSLSADAEFWREMIEQSDPSAVSNIKFHRTQVKEGFGIFAPQVKYVLIRRKHLNSVECYGEMKFDGPGRVFSKLDALTATLIDKYCTDVKERNQS